MYFTDRGDAGRQLARQLEQYRRDQPVVLGLARGGVPVAARQGMRRASTKLYFPALTQLAVSATAMPSYCPS